MVIGTFAGIGLQEYFHLPEHNEIQASTALSGFGEITLGSPQTYSNPSEGSLYTNDLGFQVLKPSNNWETHAISERMTPQKLEILKSQGLLDGIYIEENHEKQFLITVVDIDSEEFELNSFVENQISQMEAQTRVNVPIKQISDSNEWAIFAMEIPTEKWNYGEQVLFLKDDKLFMLQYSGQNPENVNQEKKSEYLSIIDSFEVI